MAVAVESVQAQRSLLQGRAGCAIDGPASTRLQPKPQRPELHPGVWQPSDRAEERLHPALRVHRREVCGGLCLILEQVLATLADEAGLLTGCDRRRVVSRRPQLLRSQKGALVPPQVRRNLRAALRRCGRPGVHHRDLAVAAQCQGLDLGAAAPGVLIVLGRRQRLSVQHGI